MTKAMTLPFQTTQDQISQLPTILTEMLLADIAPDFAERVISLAAEEQPMFELLEIWVEHRDNPVERGLDLQAIVETLWDYELWSKLQLGMTYRDINVPYPITLEQRSKLHRFAIEMLNADLKPEFVDRVVEYAREDQGMYEIVEMCGMGELMMIEPKHDVSIQGDLLKGLDYIATCLECDKSTAVSRSISVLKELLQNVVKGHRVVILHDSGTMEQIVLK